MSAYATTPEDIPHAFARAWMARDADALAALFAEDADFINVVGLWWHDRDAIRKAHNIGLTTFFAHTTLRAGVVRVKLLGADAAVVQCRYTLSGQRLPDGSEAGARRSVLTFVAERQDRHWPVVAAQNTDIVDGAETNVKTDILRPADYRK